MPEPDFSNREIMMMFEQIKTELSHIKDQTTKHNGRMAKAEDRLDTLSTFQTKVMTVWGVAVTVIAIVVNKLI